MINISIDNLKQQLDIYSFLIYLMTANLFLLLLYDDVDDLQPVVYDLLCLVFDKWGVLLLARLKNFFGEG